MFPGAEEKLVHKLKSETTDGNAVWLKNSIDGSAYFCFLADDIITFDLTENSDLSEKRYIIGNFRNVTFYWLEGVNDSWDMLYVLLKESEINPKEIATRMEKLKYKLI